MRIFITGVLAALPLAATAFVIVWLARLLYTWLGPHSLIGSVLVSLGLGLGGSEVVGYMLGVAIVLVALFGLGLLVEAGLQRGLQRLVNGVIRRIPLVRNVYDLISRFVDMLSKRDDDGLKSMSAVWCHFGGVIDESAPPAAGRAVVLALLSTPEPLLIGGRPHYAVLVPTAPVPIGGALFYVPVDWVRQADLGMEQLTSLYVSMGITSPQHLPTAPGLPARPPALEP